LSAAPEFVQLKVDVKSRTQPCWFNLVTAKALGLDVPPAGVLVR
jgi:hypothetical protein